MPARRKNELIQCERFQWKLFRRNGVYWADGRSNQFDLGRQSLSTRDRKEALKQLVHLDLVMAVKNGEASPSELDSAVSPVLSLDQAFDIFINDRSKARVAGGVKEATLKVYRRLWRKFLKFAAEKRITHVRQISREILNEYSLWAETRGSAPNYVADLVSFIIQIINTLIQNGHLDPSCKVKIKIRKFEVDEAYCYTGKEFRTMVELCQKSSNAAVRQLGEIILALGFTGMRISELLSLQWQDINLNSRWITVKDDSAKRSSESGKQTTKSSKSRKIPIHKELLAWLKKRKGAKAGLLFKKPDGGKLGYCALWELFVEQIRTPLIRQFPRKEGMKSFADGAFHSLRHYYCSTHANQGVSEMAMCRYLGHQSSRITRRYFHNNDEESLRRIDAVDVMGPPSKAEKLPARPRGDFSIGKPKDRHFSGVNNKGKAG